MSEARTFCPEGHVIAEGEDCESCAAYAAEWQAQQMATPPEGR